MRKRILFYCIKWSWKRFMKEFKWKIFTNRNFADFAMKTLCIQHSNSHWIITNLTGRRLFTVHNYTFKMFLLFTFLDSAGWNVCFIVTLAPLESKTSTSMGGTTSVCNAKNILGLLLGLSFHKIPPWLGLRKVGNAIYNLISDGTDFVPPFRNIDQPLQIDVKYVCDSYCVLIIIFILKKKIFSHSTIFFFLRHLF